MNAPAAALSVVLVQPPSTLGSRGESALLTKFDSVGLLALRAYLQNLGHTIHVFNASRALEEYGDLEAFWQKVAGAKPDLIGISMNWLHLGEGALELAAVCKQRHPRVPVILGGNHASLFAAEILRDYHGRIDGIAKGEAEETVAAALEAVRHRLGLGGIAGLAIWQDGRVQYEPRRILLLPEQLPIYSYQDIWPRPRDPEARYLAALSTTRGGCRKDCSFCLEARNAIEGQRDKPMHFSAGQLLDQTRQFIREGRTFVTIEDQISSHAESLVCDYIEGLIRHRLNLQHLSLFIEPTSFSPAVYDLLEQAPVRELVLSFGIETGSPQISQNLKRPYDYSRIYQELEYVGQKPYFSATWWLLGLPGEGEEEVAATQAMIAETMRMGVLAHSVSPLILFPQVALAGQAEGFGLRRLLTSFEDFKVFSRAIRNEDGIYPELITHESSRQSKADTLRHLREVKLGITELEASLENLRLKKQNAVSTYTAFRKKEIF